jgi:transcriptional regulator with XRE-family HTH domain
MLVAGLIARGHVPTMANKKARPGQGVPPSIKKMEGKALHDLWRRRKRRSQAEFAAQLGFTQGYLPQFFGGLRPLTVDLASKFADELGVDIGDFSPRLAQQFHAELTASEWPFRGFTRAQYQSLTQSQKSAVEALVNGFLQEQSAPASRRLRRVI